MTVVTLTGQDGLSATRPVGMAKNTAPAHAPTLRQLTAAMTALGLEATRKCPFVTMDRARVREKYFERLLGRQRDLVVRGTDLKSKGPRFKSPL